LLRETIDVTSNTINVTYQDKVRLRNVTTHQLVSNLTIVAQMLILKKHKIVTMYLIAVTLLMMTLYHNI